MSVIHFKCASEKRDEVKKQCWDLVHEHYSNTVFPNSNVKYENEGVAVYAARLDDLMTANLCKTEDTDDGINFEFDSTEDAGFTIASGVYGTGMGYSDSGLTFLKPLFEAIVDKLPDVPFTAECECFDNWVSEEYHLEYDGKELSGDAEWLYYQEFEE